MLPSDADPRRRDPNMPSWADNFGQPDPRDRTTPPGPPTGGPESAADRIHPDAAWSAQPDAAWPARPRNSEGSARFARPDGPGSVQPAHPGSPDHADQHGPQNQAPQYVPPNQATQRLERNPATQPPEPKQADEGGGGGGGMGAGSARNAAISFAGAVLAAVFGFVLYVVVGRGLGAAGAGLFVTVTGIFLVLSNAMKLGADTGLLWALPRLRAQRRFEEARPVLSVALNPVWMLSGAVGLAVFLAAPQLAAFFFEGPQGEQIAALLRIVAPALVLAAPLAVALAGTRGLGSVVPFTVISNIALPLARPLLIVGVLFAGLGAADELEAALAAWTLPVALGCVAAFVVLTRALRGAERRAQDEPRARRPRAHSLLSSEFWSYSRPRAVSALLEIALVWADVLLLSILAGPIEAGVYGSASRFVTTGTLAEAAMRVALSPRLSELLALGKVQVAGRLIGTASVWITAISWPLYLVLATFSPYVLQLFGPEFAAGGTALTILALAMAVSMTAGNVQTVLLMSGHSQWQLCNKAAAVAVDIGLCFLLIPRIGMEGAAYAWAAAILLDTTLALTEVRYGIGVRSYAVRRGKRGVSDWRSELSALMQAMSPLAPMRAAEAERGKRRSDEAALAVLSRRGMALLPVGAAAAVAFGGLGLLLRVTVGPTTAGFAVYLAVAVPLYAAALWQLRALLDVDTIIAGLRKKGGRQPA